MKILVFILLLAGFQLSYAETYNLNSSGFGTCGNPPGIDTTFICSFAGDAPVEIGTFTDITAAGSTLDSISLDVYGACSSDNTFFLNGIELASGTVTGPSCSCQSIASDANNPQNYSVTLTPAIQASFVAGGNNTLTMSSSNGNQCAYGADVQLTASIPNAEPIPTLSVYGFFILIGLIGLFGVSFKRKT